MPFKEITPYIKIVSQVTATPRRLRNGDLILWFSFAETLLKSYGKAKRWRIEVDAESNRVKCTVDTAGQFQIKELSKGGGRVQLAAFGVVRDGLESDDCKIIERTETFFIFELPHKWIFKEVPPLPTRPPTVLKAAPPIVDAADGAVDSLPLGKIDAVSYLKSKNYKVSKLAGDWWQLGNERVPKRRILEEINKLRLRAELPPVTLEQVQ